jgi:hypothetical protein
MAFCLFSYAIGKFLIHSQGFPGFEAVVLGNEIDHVKGPNFKHESLKKYRSMVDDLEKRLRYVQDNFTDPTAGPIHMLCTNLRQNIVGKIQNMLIPMGEQPEWGTEIKGPKDNLFKLVLVSTEHGTEVYDMVKKQGFLWFARMHFQADVFFLMVGHLCTRLTGSLVDRAWRQVEKVYQYHDELLDMSQRNNLVLASVVLRAWRKREEALILQGIPPVAPGCVFRLRELVPTSESGTTDDNTPSVTSETAVPPVGLRQKGAGGAGGDVDMGAEQPELDQFLGGFFDVTALDWDAWGNMATGGDQDTVMSAFGGSTFAGMNNPDGRWP